MSILVSCIFVVSMIFFVKMLIDLITKNEDEIITSDGRWYFTMSFVIMFISGLKFFNII